MHACVDRGNKESLFFHPYIEEGLRVSPEKLFDDSLRCLSSLDVFLKGSSKRETTEETDSFSLRSLLSCNCIVKTRDMYIDLLAEISLCCPFSTLKTTEEEG